MPMPPGKYTSAGGHSTWFPSSWAGSSMLRASRAIHGSCRGSSSKSTGPTGATGSWSARADFARDEPGIIEALVRGIFDAMTDLKQEPKKKELAELMAKGYNIPAPDALSMQGDANNTNWAENSQFFLNQNNPTNFER